MKVGGLRMGLGVLALAVSLLGAPVLVQAQDETPDDSTTLNKIVKLDLESADLYYALKLLFSQIKADFTLPPDLRGTLVTVRVNQPFRIALEAVLKASGLPLTWKKENNIYSIVPITQDEPTTPVDPGTETQEDQPAERSVPRRLRVNNISGIDIVAALGGRFIPFTGSGMFVGFNPFGGMGMGMGMMGGGMGMMGGGLGMMGGGFGGLGMGMGGLGMGGFGGFGGGGLIGGGRGY
ncbi:MAG: hypothetical protein RMJ43_12250 [Chloroherpetonaceae bacterium]|nr:hypothetical protein [Chthonomonadaceae bacterium]MDW8208599.1 hypothetical protein [Chloroherpetonaceae bacterium]